MKLKRKIHWLVAFYVLLLMGILSFFPGSASAHGTHEVSIAVSKDFEDPAHAAEGHPGHCHGGSFCSGIAMIVAPPVPPGLIELVSRVTVPANSTRTVSSDGLDPPPPRSVF